jgi:iron complex outermembrane receptor protein
MGLILDGRPTLGARRALALASSSAALILAAALGAPAQAADATADATADAASNGGSVANANAGGEGIEVHSLVVTAESTPVTATAPTKASLDETQPESIITHKYIEQATPEAGGWTTVVSIAPSIAGATSNGGGVGDYQTVTMRGFQDGFFNLTYDGIAFGDTNNPTHHSADYWPASTIGAVVVDRGPGAAGDLGQANFGGAIHFFSPEVTDTFGVTQKVTYGTYDTWASVTTLNTGAISQLGGAKLLLSFDERSSDGELTNAGGHQDNQFAKLVIPIGNNITITGVAAHEINYFNFEDSSGPGETWEQALLFGKNFSMTNDPNSEHFKGFNYELKRTDFEYLDFKDQLTPSFSAESQAYTYWYSNKTHSTDDLTGDAGPDLNSLLTGAANVANTSPPKLGSASQSIIGGYDKLNEYRVFGDIVRLNQDWSFGTLKIGGLVEGSRTFRHKCFIDESLGLEVPDNEFVVPPNANANCSTLEESSWLQGQAFADFYWRPLDNLTITPGFKFVDFTRNVNASAEAVAGMPGKVGGVKFKNEPLDGSNNYTSPLYFLTVNYKILPEWAVYGQYATSFLIPELSDLYVNGINLNTVKPQYTTNYQLGTVYTKGRLTADADIYLIDATNLQIACTVPDGNGGTESSFCNTGSARYDGVEGEVAYAFPFGLTAFANGALNIATQLPTAADPAIGINTALPKEELPGAPRWTAAVGALYDHGPWKASLTFKQVGTSVQYNSPTDAKGNVLPQVTFHLPNYDTLDGSLSYVFPKVEAKLQIFNILGQRSLNSFVPGGNSQSLFSQFGADGKPDSGIYTFQAGRQVELTLIGRF